MTHLSKVLKELRFSTDIRPHIEESFDGDLIWTGMFDARNSAPIGDTRYGTRFAPIQIVGLLYEIGLRPDVLAVEVLDVNTTKAGNLRKFGSHQCLHPRNLSPWRRRFCTLGTTSRVPPVMFPVWARGTWSRRNKQRLNLMAKALTKLQGELMGHQLCFNHIDDAWLDEMRDRE